MSLLYIKTKSSWKFHFQRSRSQSENHVFVRVGLVVHISSVLSANTLQTFRYGNQRGTMRSFSMSLSFVDDIFQTQSLWKDLSYLTIKILFKFILRQGYPVRIQLCTYNSIGTLSRWYNICHHIGYCSQQIVILIIEYKKSKSFIFHKLKNSFNQLKIKC